jgi:hypothetical protein
MRVRFQSAKPDQPSRVDREKRVIYGVSLLQTGEAIGHDMLVDEKMLAQCVDAVNATGDAGIKSRFTHPGACSDAMGKMLGKVKNARVVGDKAVADLYLAGHASKTPDGDLAEYVMSMAEESPSDFGMSIAFDGSSIWKNAAGAEFESKPTDSVSDKPFARIAKLRASDIVDEPAANRDGLFAAFSGTSNLDAAEMFSALDQAQAAMGWDAAKTSTFLRSYLAARTTKETRMDPVKFSALLDAEPAHAAALGKLFAAGKSEAEITDALADMKSAAEFAAVKADLTAEKAKAEKYAADLAAEKAAHAQTASKLSKLSALAGEAQPDPGASPAHESPQKSDDQIKSAWAAMPSDERSAYLGDFETYRFHVKNAAADKAGEKE